MEQVVHYGFKSPYTNKLIHLLKDGTPGDVRTDEELSEYLGVRVSTKGSSKGYSSLITAIKHVCDNYQVVWDRVYGEGMIKCLNNDEKLNIGRKRLKHTRKSARRTVSNYSAIDYSRLLPEEKNKAYTEHATAGAIAYMSNPSTVKRVSTRVSKPLEIDHNKVLDMFS